MSKVPKTKRVTDPHCDAVYSWEQEWLDWNRNRLGITACRKLIRRACRWYKVPYPTVVHHNCKELSYSVPEVGYVSLQGGKPHKEGGRNVATAMHEAAHHIGWHLRGENIQDHGPFFIGLYIALLVRAKVAPEIAITSTAKAHGLKWKRHT